MTAADLAGKALKTAGGDSITYDNLIIATGARVSRMGYLPCPHT